LPALTVDEAEAGANGLVRAVEWVTGFATGRAMGVPRISVAGGSSEAFSPQPANANAAKASALVNRDS
jgi:hypothetical protein